MAPSRVFRLVEGSLVALFFFQAARAVFAVLLRLLQTALIASQVDLVTANAHLFFVGALVLLWLVPRQRRRLPVLMMLTAIGAGAARVGLPVQLPLIRFYSGLLVFVLSAVYFASLIRANYRTWIAALVMGLTLEQLLRARDTFDLTLHAVTNLPVGDLRLLRMPMAVLQIVVLVIMVGISVMARRSAHREPYEPANVTSLGGLAFGGFVALHLCVLGLPNVMARWAEVPYAVLVPWVILATVLPMLPASRRVVGEALGVFDDRLRGWVWLFLFLLMLMVGNRLRGLGAAGALIIAQFMAVMLLWWIPRPLEPQDIEQVGPSLSLGLSGCTVLVYAYSLAFEIGEAVRFLNGQGITILLVAGGMVGLPRLLWREDDPWMQPSLLPRGFAAVLSAPAVVFGLVLSGSVAPPLPSPMDQDVRVATYNINGGYDAQGVFQLEQVARAIEVSGADIVAIQEADTGRPLSYGVDEIEYLARRLGMYQAYQPTVEHVRGVAILSRWPVAGHTGVLLPSMAEQMGAIQVRVVDPATGRELSLIGVQFEATTCLLYTSPSPRDS